MPTECYSGIEVPTPIGEICLGKYTSTDCSLSPNANIILDLPSGASQTETNAALTTALVYKEQQIEDLQNSILTIDGSETKVEAGDNVTVTGTGTNLNPYVVNAVIGVNQDLQSVIEQGTSAQIGNYYAEILTGILSSNYTSFGYTTTNLSTSLYIGSNSIFISSELNSNNSVIDMVDGELTISKKIGINGYTKIKIINPTIDSNLNFPAKLNTGNYTVNTTDDNIYLVSTLPSAVLNDMAIVSDATAPTYLGALTGGGAVVCPVWYNGTIWVSR